MRVGAVLMHDGAEFSLNGLSDQILAAMSMAKSPIVSQKSFGLRQIFFDAYEKTKLREQMDPYTGLSAAHVGVGWSAIGGYPCALLSFTFV